MPKPSPKSPATLPEPAYPHVVHLDLPTSRRVRELARGFCPCDEVGHFLAHVVGEYVREAGQRDRVQGRQKAR